jgi:hypothetical protein
VRRLAAFIPVILDLVIPTLGYFVLHALGMSDVWALTVAGSAAAVTTVVNTIRSRKIDLIGALVVAELAASVALAAWTDNPRLVLARAALQLAIGGGVLIWSGLAGRPLTYPGAKPMATKGNPVRSRAYSAAWDNSAEFRSIHIRLSVTIGALMVAYAVLRLVIIAAASSVAEAVWAQEVPGIVLLVLVLLLIRLRVPKLSRIVDIEQERLSAPPAPDTVKA